MTLNEIITQAAIRGDAEVDAAFELWDGQRPIEIRDNFGTDWREKPIVLEVDGQTIHLTANQADAIRAKIDFVLQDYGIKIQREQAQRAADLIDKEAF